jgi:hypothetical protein
LYYALGAALVAALSIPFDASLGIAACGRRLRVPGHMPRRLLMLMPHLTTADPAAADLDAV